MKNLILATAFAMLGTITVSAQTTQKKRTDTARPDTTRQSRDMHDGSNKSKSDTAKWKNTDATTGDKKMKKKNK
jgi:hypothetical protein